MQATILVPTHVAAPGAKQPAIRIDGVTKRFAVRRSWLEMIRHPRQRTYTTALAGVSLQCEEGEIVGLLGVNGAGKTTLLKILSTLVAPDAGSAAVAGFDVVRGAAQARRLLAPVTPDERSLEWRLNARENLRFFATLHGLYGRQAQQRIDELLVMVDLAGAGQKLVGAFSSGMKQRLLVARGLLARPRVLLLDEPTRSLDPLAARAFRGFLRSEIAAGQGCTVLLATHDAEEALDLCDRVAILDRGRLLAVGSPTDLSARLGEQRYRIWMRDPDPAGFTELSARCSMVQALPALAEDGCSVIEVELHPERSDPADVLRSLVSGGAAVVRFEKVPLTLADLMERAVRRGAAEHAS